MPLYYKIIRRGEAQVSLTMADDLDLYKRRIVRVLDYFDEEHELPWNYVTRSGDGRFEALVNILLDHPSDDKQPSIAHERSLGIFDSCDAAVKAIQDHEARIDAAIREEWRTRNDLLDLNKPTEH